MKTWQALTWPRKIVVVGFLVLRMNLRDRLALTNQLYSAESNVQTPFTIVNALPIGIIVYKQSTYGLREAGIKIEANSSGIIANGAVGAEYTVATQLSGSFVASVEQTASSASFTVDYSVLKKPNDIGPHPRPTTSIIVPVNSPLVLIAVGPIGKGGIVTREQYWNLEGDSYCLAPHEERTISYTIISGRQETSSAEATVSASVDTNASAGWGAASASISASLSASASIFQQVSVTETSTSFVEDKAKNDADDSILVLRWQLTDVITVYDSHGVPQSSIVTGLKPIVAQALPLSALKASKVRPERPLVVAKGSQ